MPKINVPKRKYVFALPKGRYPIHDIAHAEDSLVKVKKYGTKKEQETVKQKVHKKYPALADKMKKVKVSSALKKNLPKARRSGSSIMGPSTPDPV